ncbi:RDHE2 dehydrogenase, partial [Pitta sordida]|nr:RDHE2 dehydrogenase [Pitta sordida]
IHLLIENFICIFPSCKRSNIHPAEIVLITGSAHGIGRQIALKFAPLGVTLVLWDIDDEANRETCRLAQQNGALRVFAYHCDCSSREDVYEKADRVRQEVGDVTILINNAGILPGKKFFDTSDEDFEKTLRINFFSQVWTCKAFLPAMIACNRGHLVSTSSAAGLLGLYRAIDYCASKSAIIALMEGINSELYHEGKHGIKTTIICPYFVNTRLSKGFQSAKPLLLPVYDVEYVACKILDAVKKEKFYLVMPPTLRLLGLKTLIPRKMLLWFQSYIKFPESMDKAFGRK